MFVSVCVCVCECVFMCVRNYVVFVSGLFVCGLFSRKNTVHRLYTVSNPVLSNVQTAYVYCVCVHECVCVCVTECVCVRVCV